MSRVEEPSEDAKQTSVTLLSGLRHPENRPRYEQCWRRFAERYTPLVYGWFHQRGVPHHDAEDETQELMRKLAGALLRFSYDVNRSFRGWLHVVVDNALKDYWTDVARQRRSGQPFNECDLSVILARQMKDEFDLDLYDEAKRGVRATVSLRDWDIFQALTETPETPDEVAERLGLTRNAVDNVKRRIKQALRQQVLELEQQGVEDGEPL